MTFKFLQYSLLGGVNLEIQMFQTVISVNNLYVDSLEGGPRI